MKHRGMRYVDIGISMPIVSCENISGDGFSFTWKWNCHQGQSKMLREIDRIACRLSTTASRTHPQRNAENQKDVWVFNMNHI